MMKSEPDNNKADQEYNLGYDSFATLKFHSSRTANKQAGWFMPYLEEGMTLLDCGCGSGSITVGLARTVAPGQVIGIDISESEVERARERAAEANITNIRFEVGDVGQLDLPDNSVDALFSHNVLEHVPEPSKALQEMYRVLKPGGVIGIRDFDAGGVLMAPEDGLFERCIAIYEADWENVGGHPRIGRHLGRLLHEAGFTDVKISASYDVFSGEEGRRLGAQQGYGIFAEPAFVERVTNRGLAKAEELEAIKKALQIWQTLPGAFMAHSHCEAVGWKA